MTYAGGLESHNKWTATNSELYSQYILVGTQQYDNPGGHTVLYQYCKLQYLSRKWFNHNNIIHTYMQPSHSVHSHAFTHSQQMYFLPMVPEGGTMGQQMDFFFSFFSSSFSSSFTPPNLSAATN